MNYKSVWKREGGENDLSQCGVAVPLSWSNKTLNGTQKRLMTLEKVEE